ncbi:LysE family translocator [Rhodobacteraceae bacterium NNCM2]|nr:LysE family translocator [Coraliihabitans acroporae]
MWVFTTAVFFLLITPGPGVLSVAGVGSGFGFRAGTRYLWGLCAGNFLVGLAVVSGLAAIVLATPWLRTVLLWASVAYLSWLAWRIATSGGKVAFRAAENAPGIRDGIMLQMINPKAYAVNTTLFTGFSFMPGSLGVEIAVKFAILNAIWIPIHFLWLQLGITLRRLDLPEHYMRAINILMALSLMAVVLLAVLSI